MTQDPEAQRALEAKAKAQRRARLLEVLVTLAPLVLVGIGAAMVYPPAGLVLPGLLAWWDLRAPPAPPPAPPRGPRGGDR